MHRDPKQALAAIEATLGHPLLVDMEGRRVHGDPGPAAGDYTRLGFHRNDHSGVTLYIDLRRGDCERRVDPLAVPDVDLFAAAATAEQAAYYGSRIPYAADTVHKEFVSRCHAFQAQQQSAVNSSLQGLLPELTPPTSDGVTNLVQILQLKDANIIKKDAPLHFVWFGSSVPDTESFPYLSNLKKFCQDNPERIINLWYDPRVLSGDENCYMKSICGCMNNFRTRDIQTLADNGDTLLTQALGRVNLIHKESTIEKGMYGTSSDLARIAIVYREGGIYFDIDARSLKEIPEMTVTHGMRLHSGVSKARIPNQPPCLRKAEEKGVKSFSLNFDNNDCIASNAGSQISREILQRFVNQGYNLYITPYALRSMISDFEYFGEIPFEFKDGYSKPMFKHYAFGSYPKRIPEHIKKLHSSIAFDETSVLFQNERTKTYRKDMRKEAAQVFDHSKKWGLPR
ncbi:glycosyltransferase [Burkholderia ubonensis]|uniref:glycosyltransferase n=1 Tax=Burkholderia ubonensis TaxID=101571 RepID=UPI0015A66477|nr:glycosyltransferase [Burkholderia ubonensis]